MYIEELWLLNFLLDFMILYGTKKLLRRETILKRIILGSLLGSITTIFVFVKLKTGELLFLKISMSIGMNILSFGKKDLLHSMYYFYMLSFGLGGVLYALSFEKYPGIFLLFLSPIILYILTKETRKERVREEKRYQVEITIEKKEYRLEGYIDTGNVLRSPISHKPIILIDCIFPKKNVIYIPYKSLNHEGILECKKPDKLFINKKEIKNCLIGFSNEKIFLNGYHCILPNQLKEEL